MGLVLKPAGLAGWREALTGASFTTPNSWIWPPTRAKTKGKVERPFRYVREDLFLARTFRNLDDLAGVGHRCWALPPHLLKHNPLDFVQDHAITRPVRERGRPGLSCGTIC